MGLKNFFGALGRGIQNAQLAYAGWTPDVIDAAKRQLAFTLQRDEEERLAREEERRANRDLREMGLKDRREAQRRQGLDDLQRILAGSLVFDPAAGVYSLDPKATLPGGFDPADIESARALVLGQANRGAAETKWKNEQAEALRKRELEDRKTLELSLLGAREAADIKAEQRRREAAQADALLAPLLAPLKAVTTAGATGVSPLRAQATKLWLDTNGPAAPGMPPKTPEQMASELAAIEAALGRTAAAPGGAPAGGPTPAPGPAPGAIPGLTPGEQAALAALPADQQARFAAVLQSGDAGLIGLYRQRLAGAR